jgi:hypothetical protein
VIVLPNSYSQVYDQLLLDVAETGFTRKLVALWPMCGALYDGDLMVLGRAVNGWDNTAWRSGEGLLKGSRRAILSRTRRESEKGDGGACPLEWVTACWGAPRGYNTRLSAFWRTARALSVASHADQWSSTLCWSNLYKVAPLAGRNPTVGLQRAQFSACAELLKIELDTFRPRRILVMAGRSWFEPFAEKLGLAVRWRRGYVEGVARDARGARWVITKHPERKPGVPLIGGARRAFAE